MSPALKDSVSPRSSSFMSSGASAPGIVVLEKQPYWVPELRRQFIDSSVTVRLAQTFSDVFRSISPGDLLLLVLEEREAICLDVLERMAEDVGRFPVLVVASGKHSGWEWVFRELGVWAFLTESDSFLRDDVVHLCRRLLSGSHLCRL